MIKSYRMQEKTKQVGFEWENKKQVCDKVEEELLELKEAIQLDKKEKIEVAPTFRLYFVDTRPLPVISSSSPSGNQSTKLLQLTTPPTGLSLIHFDLSLNGMEQVLLWVSGYEKFPEQMKRFDPADVARVRAVSLWRSKRPHELARFR